jgi:hypothetical protein
MGERGVGEREVGEREVGEREVGSRHGAEYRHASQVLAFGRRSRHVERSCEQRSRR